MRLRRRGRLPRHRIDLRRGRDRSRGRRRRWRHLAVAAAVLLLAFLQRGELRDLKQRVGNVTWVQYCTDSQELARFYRAADLFVHPGVQETFGLTALESQACATPVVGIRGSYMDRIIFGSQRYWAKQNSVAALADAVAAEAGSVEFAKDGWMAAQSVRERYAWPVVFARLFQVYRRVRAEFRAG